MTTHQEGVQSHRSEGWSAAKCHAVSHKRAAAAWLSWPLSRAAGALAPVAPRKAGRLPLTFDYKE